MRKYLEVVKIAYSLQMVYRAAMAIRAVRDIATVLFFVLLWTALFRQKAEIGGYNLSAMITYYVLAKIIDQLYSYEPSRLLSRDVLQGDLSNYLAKPWKYFLYLVSYAFGRRLARTTFSFLVIFLAFIFLPQFMVLPVRIIDITFFIPSAILSWVLLFEMVFVLGTLSFWFSETSGLRTAFEQLILVVGGMWVPLNLFPGQVAAVLKMLPFQYLYFHLIAIYQGKLETNELISGLVTQTFWVFALGLVAIFLWKRGLRVYGAYGR